MNGSPGTSETAMTGLAYLGQVTGWMIFAGGFLLLFFILFSNIFRLWIMAYFSGAGVSIFTLVGMRLRKVDPAVVVDSRIISVMGAVPVATPDLEAHYLAGGNVGNVVRALIAANRAGIDLDFKRAAAIDLAGEDVLEVVRAWADAKAGDRPDPGRDRGGPAAPAREGIRAFPGRSGEDPGLEGLVGRTGEAAGDLRPTGIAVVDGRRVEAVTRGELVARGSEVKVIRIEGNRVVVTAAEQTD